MKERLHWIDICRGLAIILVVVGHVVSSFYSSGRYIESTLFNQVGVFVYSFHMPLFFVISGYLTKQKTNTRCVTLQIKRKMIVLGIPYLFFSIVTVALKLVAKDVVNAPLGVNDLLGIFLYPIGPLWFLYALLLISVIHFVLIRNIKSTLWKALTLCITFALMAFAVSVERGRVLSHSWVVNSIIIDVCKYAFWYEAGVLLMESLIRVFSNCLEKNKKYTMMISIIEVMTFIAIVAVLNTLGVSNILTHTALACIGILLCIKISMEIRESQALEFFGKRTMEIYLLHTYVVSALRVILVRTRLLDSYGVIPLVVCSLAGIVVPVIVFNVVKRIRLVHFFFYPQHYIK